MLKDAIGKWNSCMPKLATAIKRVSTKPAKDAITTYLDFAELDDVNGMQTMLVFRCMNELL